MPPTAAPLPLSQLWPSRPLGVSGSRGGRLHRPAADASALCWLPDQARGEGEDLEEEMVPVWHGPQATSLLHRLDWPGARCAPSFQLLRWFSWNLLFCRRLWWEEAKGGHLLPGHRGGLLRPSTNCHFGEFPLSIISYHRSKTVCSKTLDFASLWDQFDECSLNWTLTQWSCSLESHIRWRVNLSAIWTNIRQTEVCGHFLS